MPITTNFTFQHPHTTPPATPDLLGALRGFVGRAAERTWTGVGFNQIWRPNHGQSGNKDFFLQLMFTEEELSFRDITGSGIANRGLLQDDILLGGLGYLQEIQDAFDQSGQHFEPGVWKAVPPTTNPLQAAMLMREGVIPHQVSIEMVGAAVTSAGPPAFPAVSITPFTIGQPTNLVHFDEEDLSKPSTSRTLLNRVAALDQAHLANLNMFLADASAGQTIIETTAIDVVDLNPRNGIFLAGEAAGPNALAAEVRATFWIERVRGQPGEGDEYDQLQYSQRVLLNFNGLSWPHVSLATLVKAA